MVIKKETERKRFYGYMNHNSPTTTVASRINSIRVERYKNRSKRTGK